MSTDIVERQGRLAAASIREAAERIDVPPPRTGRRPAGMRPIAIAAILLLVVGLVSYVTGSDGQVPSVGDRVAGEGSRNGGGGVRSDDRSFRTGEGRSSASEDDPATSESALPAIPMPGADARSRPASGEPTGRLVFERGGELYTMRLPASDPVKIGAGNQPAWSPDGYRLAYSAAGVALHENGQQETRTSDIYTMRPDGSDVRRLTHNPRFDFKPTWAPDGRWIAFSGGSNYARAGDAAVGDEQHIYVVRADGTEERTLTGDSSDSYFHPAWSPDGSWIAVVRATANAVGPVRTQGGDPELGLVSPDASKFTALAIQGIQPAWSPDGRYLAYGSDNSVWVGRMDGSGATRLTSGFQDSRPAWSQDGEWIAFTRVIHGGPSPRTAIFAIRSYGSEERQLTHPADSESDTSAAFAPERS